MFGIGRGERGRSERLVSAGVLWFTAFLSFAEVACLDEEPDTGLSSEQDWCTEMCRLYLRCEGPAPGCTTRCPAVNEAYFARSHPDALRLEAQCIEESECQTNLEDVLADCYDEAVELQGPTEESMTFCEAMDATFFDCYWFDGPIPCAQFFAHSSRAALQAALVCEGALCGELETCLARELWGGTE